MITIDVHEPDDFEKYLKMDAKDDTQWERKPLSAGDFLVKDYIIERKQYGDFISRLTNSQRDIWQQMLKVHVAAEDLGYIPVLLLEGEWAEALRWTRLTAKEVTMAIGSIMKLGISVVHTVGPRASAQLMIKLDDDSEHDVGSIRDSPSVPPELYPVYLTEGFVGVGSSRAKDILRRYGSFAAVIQQLLDDPDDLKEIDGIGDATVEKMVTMINQQWE